jgi:hypothetical protein
MSSTVSNAGHGESLKHDERKKIKAFPRIRLYRSARTSRFFLAPFRGENGRAWIAAAALFHDATSINRRAILGGQVRMANSSGKRRSVVEVEEIQESIRVLIAHGQVKPTQKAFLDECEKRCMVSDGM